MTYVIVSVFCLLCWVPYIRMWIEIQVMNWEKLNNENDNRFLNWVEIANAITLGYTQAHPHLHIHTHTHTYTVNIYHFTHGQPCTHLSHIILLFIWDFLLQKCPPWWKDDDRWNQGSTSVSMTIERAEWWLFFQHTQPRGYSTKQHQQVSLSITVATYM